MYIESKKVILKDGRQLILRSATALDAQNLIDHLVATHTESYQNLNQSAEFWRGFSVSDEEKILKDFEAAANKFMLVAVANDEIVGGLGLVGLQAEFIKRTAQFGMSIQNKFRGFGLGYEMVTYALSNAKAAGLHRVELTVRTYNASGIRLYEKVGFERIGTLRQAAFIDGEFVDEFSYQKILN